MWNARARVAIVGGVPKRTARPATRAAREVVGSRIRALRRAAGWTLEDLAERADLHPNFLGLLERGRKNPSIDVVSRVAVGLGVELASLVDAGELRGATELRALIRERTASMADADLRRVLRVLDAIR